MKKCFGLFLVLLLIPSIAHARIYVPIDQPSDQKFPIAVADLEGGGQGKKVAEIIRNDMDLSGYFRVIGEELFKDVAKQDGISQETIRFPFWSSIGAQALVKGKIVTKGGKMTITLRLFDPYLQEMLVGKQYKAEKKHLREVAHRFSDAIMEALTGIPGVFNTQIAYTAISGKGKKDIYIMDMDGYNPSAVTSNKSLNLSPSWSPSGDQIVFTSYVKGFPDLYITALGKKGMRHITKACGSNITPAWSPQGAPIIFGSSLPGISNLYAVSPRGGNIQRLTNGHAIDLSPSFSPDGANVVFASERAGGLHLFKMPTSGAGVQRLTFVGYQNDMPSWSPMGDKIAFAGRSMGTFDIFIMNVDGSNIQRLTIASGSNESPSFSPDGRLIAFSSTRDGGTAIYIMRADGSNQMRVSKGNGMLPDWGPRKAE